MHLQDDQLYMAVCFRYLENVAFPVSTSDTFERYQNNTAMFIWSGRALTRCTMFYIRYEFSCTTM